MPKNVKKVNKEQNKKDNKLILDDTKWIRYTSDKIKDSKLFMYNDEIKDNEFKISQEHITKAKSLDKTIFNDDEDIIYLYKFYKIYDDTNVIISYTRYNMEIAIINDLINLYNDNQKYKKLECFKNIENVKYKLLNIYKASKDDNVAKELREIKVKIDNDNNVSVNKENKKINEDYFDYINDLFKTDNKVTYYIQKIYDPVFDTEIYICGSFNKLKQLEIKEYLKNNNIEFKNKKLKVEVIKEVEINNELAGLIKIDEYIKLYDTINKGLNKKLNIIDKFDNKEELFMIIQESKLINGKINLGGCQDNNCIASIDIGNYKYIFMSDEDIDYNLFLRELYNMRRHCFKQYEKLVNLLKVTQLEDIKINTLEYVKDKKELRLKFYYHINNYKKEQILNYYDFDDSYMTKDEFKIEKNKINNYMFSFRKK